MVLNPRGGELAGVGHRVTTALILAVLIFALGVGTGAVPAQAQEPPELEPALVAWLDDHGPLRVGWSADLRPVSIVEDGVVTGGYAVDAWDLAALRLGIELEHRGYPDARSLGEALDAGEIDVVGALGFNPAVAEGRQASEPYAWVPAVFVGRPEQASLGVSDLSGRTLTMLPGAVIRDEVMQEHPGATYVPTDGPVEGLQAVAAGEIDLYFGPLALLGHQINRLGLDLVPIGDREDLNTVQSWAEPGSEAAAIADAVRSTLSRSDLAILHVRWTGFDLSEPRPRPLPSWLAPAGLALVATVLVLALFAFVLRRQVARATGDLRHTNERLEEIVSERTGALSASNEALQRFASTAAHDLKGPVAAISGLADLLARRLVPEKEHDEVAGRIRDSATRLATRIDAMLKDAVRSGGAGEVVDGAVFAEWLHATFGAELAMTDAELRIDIPDGPLDLDEEVLHRSTSNLVGNAIKYAQSDDRLVISVELRRTTDAWELTVADNGPGIPPDQREAIFHRGTRLVEDERGFGLGLSMLKELIEGAGGSIRVEDTPLGGAAFTLVLPVETERVQGPVTRT